MAFVSFIIIKIYQKIRVPEGLKNIPTISFFSNVISLFARDGPDKRWEKMRKIFEKEGIAKV